VNPLAATPDARRTAADSTSLEAEGLSSLTQQFIRHPKKEIGSWGISSHSKAGWRYINGMKVSVSRGKAAFSS
jgi:hypothetical protein